MNMLNYFEQTREDLQSMNAVHAGNGNLSTGDIVWVSTGWFVGNVSDEGSRIFVRSDCLEISNHAPKEFFNK